MPGTRRKESTVLVGSELSDCTGAIALGDTFLISFKEKGTFLSFWIKIFYEFSFKLILINLDTVSY
jgi:hypothetical protein